MNWPSRHLEPGEELVAVARRHWAGLAPPVAVAVGAVAGAVVAAIEGIPRWAAIAVVAAMALALGGLVVRYLRWARAPLAVTTHRLLVRRGPLRRPFPVDLRDVRDIRVRQTRRQRALRTGALVVDSGDPETIEVRGLAGPADVRRRLWRQVDARRLAPPTIDLTRERSRLSRR